MSNGLEICNGLQHQFLPIGPPTKKLILQRFSRRGSTNRFHPKLFLSCPSCIFDSRFIFKPKKVGGRSCWEHTRDQKSQSARSVTKERGLPVVGPTCVYVRWKRGATGLYGQEGPRAGGSKLVCMVTRSPPQPMSTPRTRYRRTQTADE